MGDKGSNCKCVRLPACSCVFVCLPPCLCVCRCVGVYVAVCVCVFVAMHMCVSGCMCLDVCSCVYVWLHVWLCVAACLCLVWSGLAGRLAVFVYLYKYTLKTLHWYFFFLGICMSMHQPWASLLVYGIKKYVLHVPSFQFYLKLYPKLSYILSTFRDRCDIHCQYLSCVHIHALWGPVLFKPMPHHYILWH